ncbi:unnamed protein product [Arabis nemorensis]|uniref:Protein kinase domain-containing protein n=1 Tax=Arabis nemorensis TaxID=586526 RepID=A0A565AZA3_9BRAS|nr:unnamed protein product [Arabis nemorensis]
MIVKTISICNFNSKKYCIFTFNLFTIEQMVIVPGFGIARGNNHYGYLTKKLDVFSFGCVISELL